MASKTILKIKDIVQFAGTVVLIAKVQQGTIAKGMVSKVGRRHVRIERIEHGGHVVQEAHEGQKVNIWLDGSASRRRIEKAAFPIEFRERGGEVEIEEDRGMLGLGK